MSAKRVLIIVQNLAVPFDRRVWQEAQTLAQAGYQVSVICPEGPGCEERYQFLDGVHIYRHPLTFEARDASGYILEYGWSLVWQIYLTAKVYFTRGFDVIHACNPPDTIFLVALPYKFLRGKKFVFDHHDINPELYEAKFGKRGLWYGVLLFLERLTFMLSDISLATNNSYRDIAIKRGKRKPENVVVVRTGPSLERMKMMRPEPELKEGKKYLVGYVGVMGQQEGIDYLLEAAHHIVHELKREDVHFTLVGGGPELPYLKKLAKSKELDDFVTFTGRVPDDELLKVLNTADVCVNPDVVNAMNDKSTMNKIMEYMCLAKPIVQFEMTEGRVTAGSASLYARANDPVDFAAKILTLLGDEKMRTQMGKYGRIRVEKDLAWEHEAPKLVAAYEKLFSKQSLDQEFWWYYHRLLAMSWPEIKFRAHEKLQRLQDASAPPRCAAADYGELPSIPGIQDKIAAWEISEDHAFRIAKQYDALYSGQIRMLGQDWPAFPHHEQRHHEKWHLDPVSGTFWPRKKFCFSIDYRHAREYGDVKYVWELNRLQFLQPLVILAFKRGNNDNKMATFCLDEIESWIDNNPPYLGINWASGIELALRIVSIITVTSFVGEHATPAQREKIWGTLHAHALWIERYPSMFSSANNHKAAEALGLFMVGALCPKIPDAQRWKEQGWKGLCECVQSLILPDGCGAEQAISYTAFTLELLMLGLVIARKHTIPVPRFYTDRLKAAAECLQWFTDSGGNHPLIGDDDNGRVFGTFADDGDYVNSVRTALMAEFQIAAVTEGLKVFPDGGYTVMKRTEKSREIMLVMDHGPLGFGSIAAHGHADALSVWLHVGGHPVLVDAGTYLYHGSSKWREYFRDTAAHNTLVVEKADSSIMAGNFNWSHKANVTVVSADERGQVVAEHDGYKKRYGVTHRRTLEVGEEGFSVEDVLIGNKPRQVDIGFLIHPELAVKENNDLIEIWKDNDPIVRITQESLLLRSFEPAWYAGRFGEKQPTMRIVFSGMLAPEQKVITRFYY